MSDTFDFSEASNGPKPTETEQEHAAFAAALRAHGIADPERHIANALAMFQGAPQTQPRVKAAQDEYIQTGDLARFNAHLTDILADNLNARHTPPDPNIE